jgi:hypothetical protein
VADLELEKVRGALARLLTEDHGDWAQIHEDELAEMLGVEPGEEQWTWRWADYRHEGIPELPDAPAYSPMIDAVLDDELLL